MVDQEKDFGSRLTELTATLEALRGDNERLRHKAQQADAANKAKSDFLTMISHEIRTPMNGVIGITELLLHSELTAKQAHLAELIHASARNLLILIDSLLDFSKIEAKQLVLEIDKFDLLDLLEDLLKLYTAAGERKKLQVSARIDPLVAASYRGDCYRIRQILVNLLGNALKFTESGFVTLHLAVIDSQPEGDELCFAVEDSGPGIPADKRNLLFIPFSQVDSSTTRRYGGTGLGLSICSKLVGLMGGEIGMESREGGGSIFYFTLRLPHGDTQLAPPPVASPQSAQPAAPAQNAEAHVPKILIVDDDRTNRLVMKEIIKQSRAKIATAADGREAVRLCEQEAFDLIFMDCQMPIMNGFAATKAIHARSMATRGRHPVIIALTADATPQTRQYCQEVGMKDYLLKPIDFQELQRVINTWVPGLAILIRPRNWAERGPDKVAPPETGPATIINHHTLAQLKKNVGDIRPIVKVFVGSLPARFEHLAKAVEKNDPEEVRMVAHTLKGSSSQFGAVRLAALCLQAEQMGKEGDLGRIGPLIPQIKETVAQVIDFFGEELE